MDVNKVLECQTRGTDNGFDILDRLFGLTFEISGLFSVCALYALTYAVQVGINYAFYTLWDDKPWRVPVAFVIAQGKLQQAAESARSGNARERERLRTEAGQVFDKAIAAQPNSSGCAPNNSPQQAASPATRLPRNPNGSAAGWPAGSVPANGMAKT